jgi:mutator protein MutT
MLVPTTTSLPAIHYEQVEARTLIPISTWILIKDRKVLTVRAKDKNYFTLPGGKIDSGETSEEALIREVKEEVGVDLIPTTVNYYKGFIQHAHGKDKNIFISMHCYFGEYYGELQPGHEICELDWLNCDDIGTPKIPKIKNPLLEDLKKNNFID